METKWNIGSCLGGFELPIFVGVDGFAYGKTGSLCCRKVRGCVFGAVCHFVAEQVFSVAYEHVMCWSACRVMEAEYCLLVHARLCSVQRILPRSWCE